MLRQNICLVWKADYKITERQCDRSHFYRLWVQKVNKVRGILGRWVIANVTHADGTL